LISVGGAAIAVRSLNMTVGDVIYTGIGLNKELIIITMVNKLIFMDWK